MALRNPTAKYGNQQRDQSLTEHSRTSADHYSQQATTCRGQQRLAEERCEERCGDVVCVIEDLIDVRVYAQGESRTQCNLLIHAVPIRHLLTVCNTCYAINLYSCAEVLFEVPYILLYILLYTC